MTMWVVVVKFIFLVLLAGISRSRGTTCAPRWFDCGNGKCIAEMWHCDGDNDCGNSNDEKDCEYTGKEKDCSNKWDCSNEKNCLSSQFQCNTTHLCIPVKWQCDGENDCDDGSDEMECNVSDHCTGFLCSDHHCIPETWHCDGKADCIDGSDEKLCPEGKLCNDSEFLCSSGSCILQILVCNGKKDCVDGSDEGTHCGDSCENETCSQNCKSTPTGPHCYCNDGYALDAKDNKTCHDIDECQQEGFCSHECTNTAGSYKCSCREGYELVSRTCRATGADPLLIYSTLKEVRGIHLRANQFFHIVGALSSASVVDVDPKSERVYWIEVSNKSVIYSTKLDGSDLRSVLSHGLLVPEDIAVDYITNNIYITDSGLRQILACKSDGMMCHVLHAKVEKPRSIALDLNSGLMYWSDWGEHSPGIYRSGMDGSRRISIVTNRIVWPNGITLDPTTNRLYWADAKLNTIEFITLDGSQRTVLVNTTVFHPYSLAVFEDTLYWSDWLTFSLGSCNKFTGHKVTILEGSNRRVMGVHVYHPVLTSKVSNPCWSNDCSHMCLMSPAKGYRCACPHSFTLSTDEKTCITRECDDDDFRCVDGQCLSAEKRCDGTKDCADGSDEVGCSNRCSTDDFQCKSGRCILKSWRCDFRDDCGDNSDEQDCPLAINCAKDQISCLNGDCVATVWRCDGEVDCPDSSDEKNCNATRCISNSEARCDYGQCVPISWVCDGATDCFDGSDERSCSKSCTLEQFQCESDGVCIDKILRCDRKDDCVDGSDEKHCLNVKTDCRRGMFLCEDGGCIYDFEVCDGHIDCKDNEDEMNCTHLVCQAEEIQCSNKRCIQRQWICDGENDCPDGSDEENCVESKTRLPTLPPVPVKKCEENEFECEDGLCIPVDLRCDGSKQCGDGSDELNCGTCDELGKQKCKDGTCINNYQICDGKQDCSSNEDEMNCNPVIQPRV